MYANYGRQKFGRKNSQVIQLYSYTVVRLFFKSVDLQKFLMMPRLPGVKTAVFTRRLVVFHETFVPLKTR